MILRETKFYKKECVLTKSNVVSILSRFLSWIFSHDEHFCPHLAAAKFMQHNSFLVLVPIRETLQKISVFSKIWNSYHYIEYTFKKKIYFLFTL